MYTVAKGLQERVDTATRRPHRCVCSHPSTEGRGSKWGGRLRSQRGRVTVTIGAHPGVHVGGQHREESIADRGTHLGPLLVAVPRCRRHVLFSVLCWRRGGRLMSVLVTMFGVVIMGVEVAMVVVDV